MLTGKREDFIAIKTNHDGMFLVTITLKNGDVIYREPMYSNNKQIILEGFSLHEHNLMLSSIKHHSIKTSKS